MNQKINFSLYHILKIILGIIFIWASYDKILNPSLFAEFVSNYKLLPNELVIITAVTLPWIEFLIGISLIFGFWVKGSSLIASSLMLIFITAFIINTIRGIDVSCGCFSLASKKPDNIVLDVIRDLSILCIGLWVLYYRLTQKKLKKN